MAKVSDFIPDEHNANKGTERGLKLLDDSLRQYGAGRSILVDKNGRVIAGNKTLERAADVGIEDVVIIQSDGTKLVAVQRIDLDLTTDDKARLLAYADNRVGEVDLSFDPAQIAADLEAGVDLSGLWSDIEISNLLADSGEGPQRPDFGGLVDQFEHDRGISPKDGNWFYVEFYGDDDTFGHLSDLLEEHLKGKHELNRAFFQEMVDNYLAKPE